MYKLLPQFNRLTSHDIPVSKITPEDFLSEAIFAGDSFVDLEAAFGRVDGVVKTATGYCGGTLKKPSYREVCEGTTGHTEAVKVFHDKRKISYRSLCDIFWETHDPTNRNYLNFGLSTHQRSAIYYSKEEERKQAQESKIRRQMKLNKRIVTKIIKLDSDFYLAENQHQKYYLQKCCWLIRESLSLRSTSQFVESNIACKLNGILGMDERLMAEELTRYLRSNELPTQTKQACEEIIQDLKIRVVNDRS
ncbi:Peptide methionine sulfoxide reductase [Melia azedarach]|uniref:Peptide methionine sulfoxide reductase n=1 Tax=Melia azedarach TaxID=155640 RepID=A0ACC1X6J3_MELAZ|nr:Peptide methionine sulfoxide reductase [Melia azedarach]